MNNQEPIWKYSIFAKAILFITFLLFSIVNYGQTDIGLIAHFPLDGDAKDAKNNGIEGNIIGATLTNDRFGNNNRAYSFDGFDAIILPKNYDLVSRSFSVWFKADTTDLFKRHVLVSDNPDLINGMVYIQVSKIGSKNMVEMYISDQFISTEIELNKWNHACITVSNTREITYYLNGKCLGIKSYNNNVHSINGDQNIDIGSDRIQNNESFSGDIDDVRIYNRALSSLEVFEIYNENDFDTSRSYNFTTLIGNASSNNAAKAIYHNNFYYVIGKNGTKGTVSKIDGNGKEVWTIESPQYTNWSDVVGTPKGLLLVGYLTNASNQIISSIVGSVDHILGKFSSIKVYDFDTNNRDFLIKLSVNKNPENLQYPYYALGGNTYSSLRDNLHLCMLNEDGELFKYISYNGELTDIDQENFRGIFAENNGDYISVGSYFQDRLHSFITKFDSKGIPRWSFDLGNAYLNLTAVTLMEQSEQGGSYIIGGYDINSFVSSLIKLKDKKVSYSCKFDATNIYSIVKINEKNIRVAANMIFDMVPKPVILDFEDTGSEFKFLSGFIVSDKFGTEYGVAGCNLSENCEYLYYDTRKDTDGFGDNDVLISLFKSPQDICRIKPINISLAKIDFTLRTMNQAIALTLSNKPFTTLQDNVADYSSKSICENCTDTIFSSLNYAICFGSTITINNKEYSVSGSYKQNFKTSKGCDSILTISINVFPKKETSISYSICYGGSISINNIPYTSEGQYTQKIKTQSGCDSILNISISVLAKKEGFISDTFCQGSSVTLNNVTYSSAGSFIQNLKTSAGCDSTLNISIITTPLLQENKSINICSGSSININNVIYDQPGFYSQTLKNTYGCDSILNIILGILPPVENEISFTICGDNFVEINGVKYNNTGQFSQLMKTSEGCDSLLIINIVDGHDVVKFDFQACNASNTGGNMNYIEFAPKLLKDLACGSISFSNVYRNNPSENKHSCTKGITDGIAMCVSSYDNCTYSSNSTVSPIIFEADIKPNSNEKININCLKFFQQAPEQFSWINGNSGTNNYPTKFGLRILKNGVEIFNNPNLSTAQNWKEEIFSFGNIESFSSTSASKYKFEILPYCLIGNGAVVSAFDIDEINLDITCTSKQSRSFAGSINFINGQAVENVLINLEELNSGTKKQYFTDVIGKFNINNIFADLAYKLSGVKEDEPLRGVTTLDLVKIQRHILGVEKFTKAHQFLAADVNGNKKISAADLVELRKVLLGIKANFEKNWLIFDSNSINISNPFQATEFINIPPSYLNLKDINLTAIKTGDVSLNENTVVSSDNLDNFFIMNNNELKIIDFHNIDAIKFVIHYDNHFNLGLNKNLLSNVHYVENENGIEILLMKSDLMTIEDEPIIKNMGLVQKIKGQVVFPNNDKVYEISFRISGENNLIQFYPNPLSINSTIKFDSKHELGKCHISVKSLEGKTLYNSYLHVKSGKNELPYTFDHSGMFIIKIENQNFNQFYSQLVIE